MIANHTNERKSFLFANLNLASESKIIVNPTEDARVCFVTVSLVKGALQLHRQYFKISSNTTSAFSFPQEATKDYSRPIYKEDLPEIQRKLKTAEKGSKKTTKRARAKAPSKGVQLNFVHG